MSDSKTTVKLEEKTVEDYDVFCRLAAFQLYLGSAQNNLRALKKLERNEDKMYHLEFGVASPIYHFLQKQLCEWGKKGFHLVPTADDITKYQLTLLYNKQQVKKKELDDYDGNKFPIHKGRKLKKETWMRLKRIWRSGFVNSTRSFSCIRQSSLRDEQHRRFELEFGLVTGLYYRMQRHLIDWGNRAHHPHLDSVGAYYDALGAKFNDELVLTKNVMSVEKYEVTVEEEEEAREAEAKEDEVCRQH